MNDKLVQRPPLQEETRRRLAGVRSALLKLHKTLLDLERGTYEKLHGRVSAGDMLKLVIQHPHFAWLHSISELIVRIDQMLDMEEQPEEAEASSLLTEIRILLLPAEVDNRFARNYHAALQTSPDVVLAHRATTSLLMDNETRPG